jgi:hypothetical protein
MRSSTVLSLKVTGTLGKFGYSNIPEDVSDEIIMISTMSAYKSAVVNAPYDDDPKQRDPRHIKEELKWHYSKLAKSGTVWVKLPWAHIAEYGNKRRLAKPYMRKGSKAAQNKMRAIIRGAVKKSIKEQESRTIAIRNTGA